MDKCERNYNDYIKVLGKNYKKVKILDVGCGMGNYSVLLLGNGNSVVGTDVEDRRLSPFKEQISFKKANGDYTYPFEDNSFDLIVSFDVIEHVTDDGLYVKEIHRLLKKGGHTVVATPNKFRLSNVLRIILSGHLIEYPLFLGTDDKLGDCIHLREYTSKHLNDLFMKYDFSKVTVKPFWFGIRHPILEKFAIEKVIWPFSYLAQYFFVYATK